MPITNTDIDELLRIVSDSKTKAVNDSTPSAKKEKPKRCEHISCKAKLMLSDFSCKCGNYYCNSHKHAELHSCSYNFKEQGHLNLEKQLVKVVSSKLDRV